MDNKPLRYGMTLGQYLEHARQQADLSIRQLEAESGVPRTPITQLLKDRVEKPNPDHLIRLAGALKIDAGELLAFLGIQPSLPEPRVYLRQVTDLPYEGIIEVEAAIEEITAKYRKK